MYNVMHRTDPELSLGNAPWIPMEGYIKLQRHLLLLAVLLNTSVNLALLYLQHINLSLGVPVPVQYTHMLYL